VFIAHFRAKPEASSRYELSPGLKELRVRVAQRAMDCGCSFGPDDIVITSSTTRGLSALGEHKNRIAIEP
jgi:DNA-binding transcriptional MocR family regulator